MTTGKENLYFNFSLKGELIEFLLVPGLQDKELKLPIKIFTHWFKWNTSTEVIIPELFSRYLQLLQI